MQEEGDFGNGTNFRQPDLSESAVDPCKTPPAFPSLTSRQKDTRHFSQNIPNLFCIDIDNTTGHSTPAVTMAASLPLPVVARLYDCSSFTDTVLPYLPQLKTLPTLLFESWNDLDALKTIYLTTNPLIFGFAFSLFLAPVFLLVSEVNKNYSQVDRMWSLLPTIYNVHYCLWAHYNGLNTMRLDNLVAFSVVWSVCGLCYLSGRA